MNVFRNPFLLVVLFCSLFLVKCTCDDDTDDAESLVAQISQSWKISTLTVNGDAVTEDIDGFTLTLNQNADAPTTYSITTGGLAYNFAPNTSGDWTLAPNNENPTSIVFSGSTATLVSASSTQLVIRYNEAAADGKPEPVVQFTLVPR
ncbi:hypothetical protein [Bernardetia sp. MNP-M8]|uniref:hypothetical protein n=1 Tax=Bernardetia sp. MNP-M8 TaxID=3127470 RepID=UPI0030D10D74